MTLLMVSFVNIQVRGWSSQTWCLSGKFPPGEKWTFMVSSHRKPSETTFSGFSLSPKQRRARSQGVISYLKCLLIPVEAFCLIVLTIPTRSTGWSLSSLDNIKIRLEKKRRVCLFSFAQNFSKITRILVIKTKRHRKSLAPCIRCIRYRLGWIFKRRIRFIGKIFRRTPYSPTHTLLSKVSSERVERSNCLVSSSCPRILSLVSSSSCCRLCLGLQLQLGNECSLWIENYLACRSTDIQSRKIFLLTVYLDEMRLTLLSELSVLLILVFIQSVWAET